MQDLENLLPKAKHGEFQVLGHFGTRNNDVGGKPEKVAVEVKTFMTESLRLSGEAPANLVAHSTSVRG